MFQKIILWDIYEIHTTKTSINGVMFRGRIRKFCLKNKRNVLVENAEDITGIVRFSIPHKENSSEIEKYLHTLAPDISIKLIREKIPNPILSKLKVNIESRYTLSKKL